MVGSAIHYLPKKKMNKYTITFTGELDYEYNEDGSKTSDVFIKSKFGRIPLNIKVKSFYSKDKDMKIVSFGVYSGHTTAFFSTEESAIKYLIELVKEKGFEVKEEAITNFEI